MSFLWTDLGIAIYVVAGLVAGICWERNRAGGTRDLRRQRDLRRERDQLRRNLEVGR